MASTTTKRHWTNKVVVKGDDAGGEDDGSEDDSNDGCSDAGDDDDFV